MQLEVPAVVCAVAAHDLLSSYHPIALPELKLLIDHLNAIYEHYKKEGFDEVYERPGGF